jgi:uncharacterized protein YndB with AHSA1/START domain
MRTHMFASIGATGTRLADVAEVWLDDQHVLATTEWDVVFAEPGTTPLTLHASYLLRRAGDDWEILVYLNHKDIRHVIATRSAAHVDKALIPPRREQADIAAEGHEMRVTNGKTTGDFTAVLHLDADPLVVSDLFTSADGLSRWWGPTEGDAAAGGTLVTNFGEYGANAMRVLQCGPTRVVWEPIAIPGTRPTGHTEEWLGTTIQFEIEPTDDCTELRFTHAGLTPQLRCWDACVAAWTQFLGSIQSAAETGTGAPFHA